ncbi:MAG: cytochrome c biogenesis protein CcsA [Cyclobacteriaceae bacterium]|nr:cytochrome c biogenesis protein CcsA [Cyclobacteriaceae bacterium]
MRYLVGNLGHLFVIISFIAALLAAVSYYKSAQLEESGWKKNGRIAFFIHTAGVLGVVIFLYIIIYRNYFEYHYAWSHSSKYLPFYYKISAFWEGQEGSFLLWIFWHVVLGIFIIALSKDWESPVMFVFSLVQAFLTSMILGVVLFNLKIGSSPFMLTREVIEAPVFQINPEFIPQDGSGLNPLLQNYWMVIHPPTLFLGFAATIVPFSFAISALWKKKYTSWIKPVMPWSLFAAAVLGLGIIMGAYWAYETLNFGGYWNWDPVENAIYVPWLVLIASIHTMLIYKKNHTALRVSFILVIATFLLILYSTFLTRSGILGNSSVHSFTDLGLSGQLLIYLVFFTLISIFFLYRNWKKLPVSEKEIDVYSRDFWIFMGTAVLCLSAFQIIIPTSIPVFNAILNNLGIYSNMAPPADQIVFYTRIQLWFALGIGILTALGQFFWWRKMKSNKLFYEFAVPLVITLLVSTLIMVLSDIRELPLLLLITAAVFAIISNGITLIRFNQSPYRLSGGAVAHIGVALMIIGIVYSSGMSRIISLNRSGMLYSSDFPDEINKENILLFHDQTKEMDQYRMTYTGKRIKVKGNYFRRDQFLPASDPHYLVAREDIYHGNILSIPAGDTVKYNPENTYYEVQYEKPDGQVFYLYPRLQENPNMGNVVSPSIKKAAFRDIYTHVTVVAEDEKEWSDTEEIEISIGSTFFVNDYVASIEKFQRIDQIPGTALNENDVAVKGIITINGMSKDYQLEPVYLIKDNFAGRIPAENEALGVRITILNILPDKNSVQLGLNTAQKDYIILKAVEKPMINILWLGTLILMIGFTMAMVRRSREHTR